MAKKQIIGQNKNFVSADAKCTFYVGERSNEIRCQGYEDSFKCALIFERPDERQAYTDLYCDNIMRCEKCHLFKSIMETINEE